MTEIRNQALQTALEYYGAWNDKDLDRVMAVIADDIVCESPGGRIEGASAYREFMGSFFGLLTRARLVAAFGDDETAMLLYDIETAPVPSAPAAEHFTVTGGRISAIRLVFDRVPFQVASAEAAAA